MYALAARTWDKVQCEVFAAVWVLSNALVPIFLIGLPTAVLYFFPRRENTRGLALQAGSCALGAAIILGGFLHLAGSELFAILHGDEGPPPGMNEPLAAFILRGCPCSGWSLRRGADRCRTGTLADATGIGVFRRSRGCGRCGLRLGIDYGRGSGTYLSCVGLLRLAAAYVLVYRVVGSGAHWGADGWRELLSSPRPIAMNDAVGALSRTVDRIVILYFFTHETFAEYHFGAVEVPISLLLAAVVTVLVPEVSALYQRGDRRGYCPFVAPGGFTSCPYCATSFLLPICLRRRVYCVVFAGRVCCFYLGIQNLLAFIAAALCRLQSAIGGHGEGVLGTMGQPV